VARCIAADQQQDSVEDASTHDQCVSAEREWQQQQQLMESVAAWIKAVKHSHTHDKSTPPLLQQLQLGC